MPMQPGFSRRDFVKTAAAGAAALSAMTSSTLLAADEKKAEEKKADAKPLRIGFIGVGKMGKSHLDQFVGYKDFVVTAICDVDTFRRELARKMVDDKYAEFERKNVNPCKAYKHYRELLDDKDVDCVLIAVPDHWHVAIAMAACKAGKDIYCEKPLTLTIHEAKTIIETVRKYDRVFQVGSQQRTSMSMFPDAVDMIHAGRLGKIKEIHVALGPTSKHCELLTEQPDPGLDWNEWLGQVAERPYHHLLCQKGEAEKYPFNPGWRDYREFSGGNVTDWGAHHIDISHWALEMDKSGPVEARPAKRGMDPYGAELVYRGSPHGMDEVVLRHVEVVYDHPDDSKDPKKKKDKETNGIRFIGEKGFIFVNRTFLISEPDEIVKTPLSQDERKVPRVDGKGMLAHHRNWMDCIRSRQRCIADVEVGARTVTACHLMNLAFWHDATFKWDPQKWEFTGDNAEEANKFRTRPRRKGYELPEV